MRTTFIFALCLLAYINTKAQSNEIVGYWLTADKTSQIRIFKATNGKYYGEICWILEFAKYPNLDSHNPDPEKRNQSKLGLRLLNSFVYSADDNNWNSGTIYDPDNGKTYDCFMWFEDDPNKLRIKGYVMGMHLLGRETTWIRESGLRKD